MIPNNLFLHLLFPLTVPLFNPGSPLLTSFPSRWRASASPRTPMLSPTPAFTVIPIPIRSSPISITMIISVSISRLFPIFPLTPVARTGAPTPAPTPSIPAVPPKQLPSQLPSNYLDMHKVTISPTVTAILLVLPTSCFAEIGDRGKIRNDRTTRVEPSLKSLEGSCGLVFLPELNIHVSNHVVGEVVTNVEALDLTKLAQLLEDVLVEVLEVLLDLAGIDGLALGIHSGSDHVRALVHVGKEESRRDRRPVVEP